MDWSGNLRTFLCRPAESTFNLLYDYNYEQYPGMDINHQAMAETSHGLVPVMDKINYGSQDKKKRLTSDQLDSLERSFQEEIKLDPDRKMKLSRELGLQPRQIAVWFQNRRARWKAKRIERQYDVLKQEYDVLKQEFERQYDVLRQEYDVLKQEYDVLKQVVSKEKQKLQEEVMTLKGMLREQATMKQMSTGYTEISGEETVESTSVAICGSSRQPRAGASHRQIAECNYVPNNVDEYNTLSSSAYWAVLPTYP